MKNNRFIFYGEKIDNSTLSNVINDYLYAKIGNKVRYDVPVIQVFFLSFEFQLSWSNFNLNHKKCIKSFETNFWFDYETNNNGSCY